MSEPTTLAIAGGIGIAFGLTGTFLGISQGVLIGGVLAGIVVIGMTDGIAIRAALTKMAIALSTAAGLGDITAYAIAKKIGMPSVALHFPSGFLIGFTAQAALLPWVTSTFSYVGGLVKKAIAKWFGEAPK